MNLAYVIDYVFRQTPDGSVWTDTSYEHEFWRPYVNAFDNVTLLCRVDVAEQALPDWKQVTGPGVRVLALPGYSSAWEYLGVSSAIRRRLSEELAAADAVILRVPSNLARCAARELRSMGRHFAVEAVGDPYDSLAPGVVSMPGRPILRSIFTSAQKSICKSALGVAYVAGSLKSRYPAGKIAATLVCSDVRLENEWIRSAPRQFQPGVHRKLFTVATLSRPYKGIDYLLRAVRICRDRHFDVSLTVAGTGRHQARLEDQARRLGIADSVTFAGVIPWGRSLIRAYDEADIFVLPSLVEVMPRALLEAMARGLPAIATNVGAIHEVMDDSELVRAGDAKELAQRILFLCRSARRLDAMSARNLARAANFSAHHLVPQWRRFHEQLRRDFEAQPSKPELSLPQPAHF